MAIDSATKPRQPAPETPRLAEVIGHTDPDYGGGLKVRILREIGNSNFSGEEFQVKAMMPFAGQTSSNYVNKNNKYDDTQKSYGMWFIPPDPGTLVIVIFINGDAARGYWIGCVPDTGANFMTPGLASTQFTVEGGTTKFGQPLRAPVAEVNKVVQASSSDAPKDFTKLAKPTSLFADVLKLQGLFTDDVRGITTSSARRETPSTVFGISTPGPVDRRNGAPTGKAGSEPQQLINVSRLGGTTFVMDDGDDNFRRKVPADKGPPNYASVEGNETDGDPTIPHNELFRIRTRTGHQILLHNSEDLIYIGNAKGTTWIELTSNGKIDIFAADSVSVHTKTDMNFYADRDINMEAGRNINLKSETRTQLETAGDLNVMVNGNYKVKVVGDYINVLKDFNVTTSAAINLTSQNTNLKTTNNILLTANLIGENGPVAATALATAPTALSTFGNIYSTQADKITSIMKRVPNQEPWPQHENLDPLAMTAAKTDREVSKAITFSNGNITYPDFYLQYTTATDTFAFIEGKAKPKKENA